jgi:hypothetical protein
MKVRMKHAIYLTLVVALLVSVLAGCAGTPAPSAAPSASAPAASASASAAPSASASASAAPAKAKEMKLFMNETWFKYQEWKGRIPDLITQKTGVKPIVTVAADATAIDLLIASGNLGDLVVGTLAKFPRLSNSNISWDIDTIAQKNNIDVSAISPVMRFVNQGSDGKVYTQFCGFSPDKVMKQYKALVEGRGIVMRTDMMEGLGVKDEDIKSVADLESVLLKAKQKYPDVVPFAYNYTHDNAFMKMMFGAIKDTTGFIDDAQGNLYAFLADPKLKDYFFFMNKLYREGLMTDENFAWKTDTADYELMVAGKLFCDAYYDNTALVWNTDPTKFKAANVKFTVSQLLSIYNNPGAAAIERVAGWRGLFIPKSCVDPALALKFNLWAWSQEGQNLLLWGEEGKDWNWSEDKTYPKLNYEYATPNKDEGMKYWGWIDHDGFHNTAPEKSKDTSTLHAMEGITKITVFSPVMGMIRLDADSSEQVTMANLEQLY